MTRLRLGDRRQGGEPHLTGQPCSCSKASLTAPAAGLHTYGKCAVVLLMAMVLLASPQQAATARACEESGYCSVGISKVWVGDITESVQLRAMLEAVTFKKELILTIFQPAEKENLWVDQALQLHSELQEMGYAHHIFITANEDVCKLLTVHDELSCVWDSVDLPSIVLRGEEALWHQRWKLMARATRLGYNVMSIDTDFIWFRDPYVHFKSGIFKDIQMLNVPEGGSVYSVNGGFVYVQNARPDGAVTWVWKQVAMSTLRRADDGYEYMSQWKEGRRNCLTFDQAIINDALCASAVGLLIFPVAMDACKMKSTFKTREGKVLTSERVKHNVESLVMSHLRTTMHKAPPDAAWLAKSKITFMPEIDARMPVSNLTVPNLAWGYPEELGGRFAPVELGNLSVGFIKQLESDCPDCPWWPEHRPLLPGDPLKELLGDDYSHPQVHDGNAFIFHEPGISQERMAQVPMWLASSLGNTRRGWVLGKNAPVQGPMVLGHVHAWHMQEYRAHKLMVRKVYGRYNWTLGAKIAQSLGITNTYGLQRDVTRVLALSPDIDLSRTRNWAELSSIIAGLVQVAYLSHRVLLMPDLPCQTAWLHDKKILAEDPEAAAQLCVAPTGWRTPYSWPIPVPLAVDERGELVGGWARRLTSLYTSGGASQSQQSDNAAETQGSGGSARRGGLGARRALREDVPDDWWQKQRYVSVMPQLWDPSCTKGFHAVIGPEFHHWLKHSEEGKAAKLQPTKSNTIFTPAAGAEGLELRPPLAPGGDSAAVPAGSVVRSSAEKGWSWMDVQAALPAAQVLEHVAKFADEPLLFLGHPVMVVHSTTSAAAESQRQQEDKLMTDPGKGGAYVHDRVKGHAHHAITPDEALSAINHHIHQSKCKGIWMENETHDGKVVDLGHGHPCTIDSEGVMTRVTPA